VTTAELAPAMQGFASVMPVDASGKIAITWGRLKTDYH
jgi:hypothetical protein